MSEYLLIIAERFELECIPARIVNKQSRLFASLALKTDTGADYERDIQGCEAVPQ